MTALALDDRMFDPARISDLIDEISGKNFVRVVKYEARSLVGGHRFRTKVLDEISEVSQACGIAALTHADSARVLAGRKPVFLAEALRRLGGELRSITPNLRTNVGADFAAAQLSGVSVAVADYIALSNNTLATANGDSSATLPWSTAQAVDAAAGAATGEYTALGVARKQATYAHTGGTAQYVMSASWTATATCTLLQKAGLFGGASKAAQGNVAANILVLENTFTPTTLNNGDTISLTWTVQV